MIPYVLRLLATIALILVTAGLPALGPVPLVPLGLALWVGSTLIPPPSMP